MPMIEDAGLNSVDAWGGEVTQLPPGEYQLKITAADVEQKESGDVIKKQLAINYEVMSGAFAGKNIKAWFGLDFSKDTPRKRLKSLVVAANIPISPNGGFDTAQLLGCKLNADVVHETYEGKVDPVLGGAPPIKTAVRVVNERGLRDVAAGSTAAPSNGAPVSRPASIPGSLPGLTKQ